MDIFVRSGNFYLNLLGKYDIYDEDLLICRILLYMECEKNVPLQATNDTEHIIADSFLL